MLQQQRATAADACPLGAGTPEAIGKADYVSTLIDQISSGLGATVGLAQVLARAINVRARRLEALHDVSLHLRERIVQCATCVLHILASGAIPCNCRC